MIPLLALPKAVNGVPVLMVVAGAPPRPRKPVPAQALLRLRLQCRHSLGPALKLNAKNIWANGALTPAVTVTIPDPA